MHEIISSAQLSPHENFLQKKTHAGSIANTTLPACCIYLLPSTMAIRAFGVLKELYP